MTEPEPIDLHHLGRERIIASYLLDTDDGPALFDCGPSTTIDALKAGLADARPRAHRHPASAAQPHPPRPRRRGRACSSASTRRCRCTSRRSARRTSSTRSGSSERAPALRRHVRLALGRARAGAARRTSTSSADRVLGLDCFPTPGHASHHVCYLDPDGTLYAGDACGVRVLPGRFVMPPTPPPEVDVDGVGGDARRDRAPRSRAARAHPLRRRRRRRGVTSPSCGSSSCDWAESVEGGATEEEFVEYAHAAARRLGRGRASRTATRCRSGSPTAGSRAGPRSARPLVNRALERHDSGRWTARSALPELPPPLRRAGDLVRRDVPRADRRRVRDPRQRRRRDRGRPQLRGLDARAGGDARVRRRRRRPVAAPPGHDRLRRREHHRAHRDGRAARLGSRPDLAADRAPGAAAAPRSRSTRPRPTGSSARSCRRRCCSRRTGYLAIARYAAFPLGAAVGGSIVALIGSGHRLLVDAGDVRARARCSSRRSTSSRSPARAPGFLQELREGWSAFVEQTWVWVLVVWISLYFLFTYAPFFVLGPYIAKHSMDGARSWAFVVTGEGIGALLGGLAGLRWRPRRPADGHDRAAPDGHGSAEPRPRVPPARRVLLAPRRHRAPGFAFALGSVVWDTTLQRKVPPDKLARVASYAWMGAMVFLPAGYALAGPIAMAIGIKTYLLIARRLDRREHPGRHPPARRPRGRVRRRDRRGTGTGSSRLARVPPVPVPPEVDAFLAQPNPAVVATVQPERRSRTRPPPGTTGRTAASC